MRRRTLLAGILALPAAVRADDQSDLMDAAAQLAGALSDGRAGAFFEPIDRSLPDHDKLQDYVNALVAQAEVTSSVQPVSFKGSSADFDWDMTLRARDGAGASENRRATISMRIARKKIVSLTPIDFFAPMRT